MECVRCGLVPDVAPEQTPTEAMVDHYIAEHDLTTA